MAESGVYFNVVMNFDEGINILNRTRFNLTFIINFTIILHIIKM